MNNSILVTIKGLLDISEEQTEFDDAIIVGINTALSSLVQLGIGPSEGFCIKGKEEEWASITGDSNRLQMVVSYVHLKVKLLFDPPSNSSLLQAIKEQINELEWRLSLLEN